MVALAVCVMWHLLLIHPSATAKDGAGLNVFATPKLPTFSVAHSDWYWRDGPRGHLGRLCHF